jgi:hypothetical protein
MWKGRLTNTQNEDLVKKKKKKNTNIKTYKRAYMLLRGINTTDIYTLQEKILIDEIEQLTINKPKEKALLLNMCIKIKKIFERPYLVLEQYKKTINKPQIIQKKRIIHLGMR